jgi:hypothetical protein
MSLVRCLTTGRWSRAQKADLLPRYFRKIFDRSTARVDADRPAHKPVPKGGNFQCCWCLQECLMSRIYRHNTVQHFWVLWLFIETDVFLFLLLLISCRWISEKHQQQDFSRKVWDSTKGENCCWPARGGHLAAFHSSDRGEAISTDSIVYSRGLSKLFDFNCCYISWENSRALDSAGCVPLARC